MRTFPCSLLVFLFVFWVASPSSAEFITSADELARQGVNFTWSDIRSKSIKIAVEYREQDGAWQRVSLGSGFLISADGLFVTAYHVMKFCLAGQKQSQALSAPVDCSTGHEGVRYRAINRDREFGLQVISHLNETDSINGKEKHTPDEIIKQRDFVVGKLQGPRDTPFAYWQLQDFNESLIDLSAPRADFQLMPLLPPKRVFIAGFPKDNDLVVSEGFLNLTEKNRRGYFAADYKVYSRRYLQSQGIAIDTQWGMGVQNHMSGGPVVDASGAVVGLVVNGNQDTAGVLSIENVLSSFFTRVSDAQEAPAVILYPTETPLFLRRTPPRPVIR